MAGPAYYSNPYPQQQSASVAEAPRPSTAPRPLNPLTTTTQDLKSAKTNTQFALREYLSLQRKRSRLDGATSLELEDQIKTQGRILLQDLKFLRKEVAVLVKDGENHRWRNWLIGGAVATFIPAVKRIFRRPSEKSDDQVQASNRTEYAFWRSKALVARIKDSLLGRNSFASIAFFVFAVLYVFTNEVSLQVAKTVSKRLKRLSAKIERGDAEVVEQDAKLLEGWRWRVLMWAKRNTFGEPVNSAIHWVLAEAPSYYHSLTRAHSFPLTKPRQRPVITMSSKKRRHSDAESRHETEKSLQTATRHAGRGSANTRPQQPGTHADAYYRNLYSTEPDFSNLGRQDPAFAAMLKRGNLDFNDPAAVMQLTKTLLKIDFGLEIGLPEDRLCPPVPNRHNYILWLKGLLDSTTYDHPDRKSVGLDIGTGASCIYPLLGCTQRLWSFFATDIDQESLAYARKNVQSNNLQSRISVVARTAQDPIISLDSLGVDELSFVMCNPPFYTSEEDLLDSAQKKSRPPLTACTGAPVEMVSDGGEVGFVGRMLEESLVLRDRVQWYTSMFGKQSSLEEFVNVLREKAIDNYAVTEFVQGNKTRRWAVAWSFGPMRPSEEVARGLKAATWKKILPMAVESEVVSFPLDDGAGKLGDKIQGLMSSLELTSWEWDHEKLAGIGRARENVWSRAWRRKKMREERDGKPEVAVTDSE
ncbi:U6 small nuclear RNA (adenine-(43)-N(6))-methyltransferase, partial [Colletotrichum shisoi]